MRTLRNLGSLRIGWMLGEPAPPWSLLAATKALHFWNPRLFVIVDSMVMESYVLAHTWIRDEMLPFEEKVRNLQTPAPKNLPREARYLALLLWAGETIRSNPGLMQEFERQICKRAHSEHVELPDGYAAYEAAAFEWLLEGLVELRPSELG
jgi:hypothetical protein